MSKLFLNHYLKSLRFNYELCIFIIWFIKKKFYLKSPKTKQIVRSLNKLINYMQDNSKNTERNAQRLPSTNFVTTNCLPERKRQSYRSTYFFSYCFKKIGIIFATICTFNTCSLFLALSKGQYPLELREAYNITSS